MGMAIIRILIFTLRSVIAKIPFPQPRPEALSCFRSRMGQELRLPSLGILPEFQVDEQLDLPTGKVLTLSRLGSWTIFLFPIHGADWRSDWRE